MSKEVEKPELLHSFPRTLESSHSSELCGCPSLSLCRRASDLFCTACKSPGRSRCWWSRWLCERGHCCIHWWPQWWSHFSPSSRASALPTATPSSSAARSLTLLPSSLWRSHPCRLSLGLPSWTWRSSWYMRFSIQPLSPHFEHCRSCCESSDSRCWASYSSHSKWTETSQHRISLSRSHTLHQARDVPILLRFWDLTVCL